MKTAKILLSTNIQMDIIEILDYVNMLSGIESAELETMHDTDSYTIAVVIDEENDWIEDIMMYMNTLDGIDNAEIIEGTLEEIEEN